MPTATARVPKPVREEGRLAGRPSDYLFTGNKILITDCLQSQFLARRYGLTSARAAIIAPLFWEMRHD